MYSKRTIQITDYDPLWAACFQEEQQPLLHTLQELCLEVFYVGTTAIPGLVAKPIIDIITVVSNITLQVDQLFMSIDYTT